MTDKPTRRSVAVKPRAQSGAVREQDVLKVSADNARRFLVARQLLAPARSLEGGPGAVLEVFRRLGSVQFDPLAIAGRTHDLMLHARVAGYDPAWCDLLYERREIFEAYNKGLSIVPTSEFPWFRGNLSRSAPRTLTENADAAARVLERIRAEGPLSALDFERERGTTTDWFGMPTNVVRAVLEAFAVTGVLGLARRDGNRRYYDLLERLLPADVLARKLPLEEQLRHKLLSRYRAHGLLGVGGADVFGGLGYAKPDERLPGYPGRNALREELIADGELVPVDVEGVRGKRYVLKAEVGALESPPEPPPSVAFLPPFDPLVWDRVLLGSLFHFDYVWELFVPPAKRRWGWYVLPLLFRDRLVGRIEPRIDRAGGRVEMIDLWWEDGFTPRRVEGFVDAMRDALRAYLRFAGAGRLEWAPHLRAEKRLFLDSAVAATKRQRARTHTSGRYRHAPTERQKGSARSSCTACVRVTPLFDQPLSRPQPRRAAAAEMAAIDSSVVAALVEVPLDERADDVEPRDGNRGLPDGRRQALLLSGRPRREPKVEHPGFDIRATASPSRRREARL